MKTCWRAVPDFRVVGKSLKDKFRSAVLVDQSNLANRDPKTRRPNPEEAQAAHQAEAVDPQAEAKTRPQERPPLLREVAQLLREGPGAGRPRHQRQVLQPHPYGPRELRRPLLRQRVRPHHAEADANLQLQVPLVLHRRVPELYRRRVDQYL
jgi:hypothetical protein